MQNFTIKIITQKGCHRCEALKNELIKSGISFEGIDAFSAEGKKITSKHIIMLTPTALFLTDSDEEIARAQNFQELKEFLDKMKNIS